MNWKNEVIHASDCHCAVCKPELYCKACKQRFNATRKLTPEEEKALSEFIDAQFEADLLEEVENLEVL